MSDPPDGFDVLVRDRATVWARPEARRWIDNALSTAPTLHAAAARVGATHMSGRGPVYPVPTARGTWVVRHFTRGGSVASLLGDRYLARGERRPFAEVRASETLRQRGIDTPAVVAAAVYRAGPFYRGDLVTELVPASEELAHVLFGDRGPGLAATADRREALSETGRLLAHLARAGVRHPDLNAKNVLIQWSGNAPRAHVLDLDRCRIGAGSVPVDAMLERLLRSIRKFERRTGLPLSEPEKARLVDAATGAR